MIWTLAASIASGLAYGLLFERRNASLPRALAKTVPVTLLALAAMLSQGPTTLVVALALCALGDWFLAHEGERFFLAGLGAFALAHVAYCWLFVAGPFAGWDSGAVFALGSALILAAVAIVYRMLWPGLSEMKLPVAAYCAVIAAMLILALGRGPDPLLLTGVALFAISDTVLGIEAFRLSNDDDWRRLTGPVIWHFYFFGQVLIALAIMA